MVLMNEIKVRRLKYQELPCYLKLYINPLALADANDLWSSCL
jgi:hypothetical protein